MSEVEVVAFQREAVEAEGSQAAFARRHGIAGSYVNDVLGGRCGPGGALVKALGPSKIVAIVPDKHVDGDAASAG